MNAVHFSSKTDQWATPQYFFDALHAEFCFDFDVCALPENAKCAAYFTPEQDGLSQKWSGSCFCNPPYGRQIGKWLQKAYESSLEGVLVVCLIPSKTETNWWHDYVLKGEIRFIRKRIKFGGSAHNAPFPSAVVIFRPKMGTNG